MYNQLNNAGKSGVWSLHIAYAKVFLSAIAVICIVMGLSAGRAAAQATSGIRGAVTDPTGAVVIGASVSLSNAAIGYSATTKTNEVGVYEFLNVPPSANYTITVSKEGFRDSEFTGLVLNVGTKATQDVQLTIGTAQANVEVTASSSETLNTTDASIGSVIDADRVQDLPNIFVNNASEYLSLAPGVTPGGAVTGTRSDETNMTLDGLDVNDQRGGFAFTPSVNTPLDSVQELKVTVTGDDATHGRSSGGQLEMATKSGTNTFHGQAFDLNRVTAYAANNYFNNLQGVPEPPLVRNQFGGNLGGPIRRDKLFFFFSYDGLRAKSSSQNNDTVPVSSFYNGQLNYVNASGNVVTTPTSGPNSLASLDPLGMGADAALLSFLKTRGYPNPNNNSVGDGLNTAGYFFVSPVNSKDNTFVGKIDYQATTNHRLFVRGTWDRSSDDDDVNRAIQILPGDPAPGGSIVDHSRSWVGGDAWTISPTLINEASFGETDEVIAFSLNYDPTAPDSMSFNDPFFGNVFTRPFLDLNQQFPVVPVYQGRDTLTWTKGKHTLQFGGVISPVIFKSGNLTDTNGYGIGLGGNLTGLSSSQRPSDFAGDPNEWDRLFAVALGRLQGVQAGYNYNVQGNALPQGQVATRDYHATEYEFFAQDTWNVRTDLTVTAGLRWDFHNPLSEVNGFEAVPNLGPFDIFKPRLQQAAQGVSGPNAIPFVTYRLGGGANNGPDYYRPDYKDFAPRMGIAYSPESSSGLIGKLLGNRQTSIRAGFGIDFDDTLIGQGFELDETSFLFSNTVPVNNGDLSSSPRFTCASPCSPSAVSAGLRASQAPPPGGTTPRPTFTPNLDSNGFPIGFFNGGFGQGAFFNFDPNYRSPYEMHFSFGVQRQLPGDWLVEATYVGKLGRRLTALADPAQTLNFVDQNPAGGFPTGQSLYAAFGAVQKQVQAGASLGQLTPQPWFENEVSAALAQTFGAGSTCQNTLGLSCTQVAYLLTGSGFFFGDGDVSSAVQSLADFHNLSGTVEQGLLLPNVALLAQDGAAGYIGNFSASNYHALIVRVNHKFSHDLTMEANYTYSHSIDNDSGVQNDLIGFAGSEVCDLRNLRVCRGSSDFDHRHLLAANFVYGLPVGRGKWLGSDMPRLLNEAIGGWRFSGIVSAYTGAPFKIDSGAFTIDFTQTQPGVFIGSGSDVTHSVHQVASGQTGVPNSVQFFSNETNAFNAFTAPIAGGPGNRNILSGPGFWNIDMSILKEFTMPWSDNQKLQFRADAFNLFNHPDFSAPSASLLNPATFGNITSTANQARQLQLGLRFNF